MAKRYTKDHEWVDDDGRVGISAHAQEQLGDVVFVDLPEVGTAVEQGGQVAVVESVKTAAEVYAPVSGTVVEVNPRLADQPARVNEDPLGEGWFFRLDVSEPAQRDGLMDEAAYADYLGSLG